MSTIRKQYNERTNKSIIDIGKYSSDGKQIIKRELEMYGSSKGRLCPPNDLGDGNMLNKTRPKLSLHSLSSIHFAKGTNIEDASDEVSDSLNILHVVNFRSKIVLDQIWHEFDKSKYFYQ